MLLSHRYLKFMLCVACAFPSSAVMSDQPEQEDLVEQKRLVVPAARIIQAAVLQVAAPGFTVVDIPENGDASPLLHVRTLPNWRTFSQDQRPFLTIDAEGFAKARPHRKDEPEYSCRMPAKEFEQLKHHIRKLVAEYQDPEHPKPLIVKAPTKYSSPTILQLRLDGKKYSFHWYRSDNDLASKPLEEFFEQIYSVKDAAEVGSYERIRLDGWLVDQELPKLGLHDNVTKAELAAADIRKISINNCQKCHNEMKVGRGGWRNWGSRHNRWTIKNVLTATVRQEDEQRSFVELVSLQTGSAEKPAPLRGQVADAYTGKPLKSFRLIAGTKRGSGWDSGVYNPKTVREFSDGAFQYETEWGLKEEYIRIEADGYYPEPLKLSNRTVLVQLRPDAGMTIKVVDQDNNPVEGATAALICPDRLATIRAGKIEPRFPNGNTLSDKWQEPVIDISNAKGEFNLPNDPGVQMVAVCHPEKGFAVRTNRAGSGPIQLNPWQEMSGTIDLNGLAVANAKVTFELIDLQEPGDNDTYHATRQKHLKGVLTATASTLTDESGKYTIRQLPPGKYSTSIAK